MAFDLGDRDDVSVWPGPVVLPDLSVVDLFLGLVVGSNNSFIVGMRLVTLFTSRGLLVARSRKPAEELLAPWDTSPWKRIAFAFKARDEARAPTPIAAGVPDSDVALECCSRCSCRFLNRDDFEASLGATFPEPAVDKPPNGFKYKSSKSVMSINVFSNHHHPRTIIWHAVLTRSRQRRIHTAENASLSRELHILIV